MINLTCARGRPCHPYIESATALSDESSSNISMLLDVIEVNNEGTALVTPSVRGSDLQ